MLVLWPKIDLSYWWLSWIRFAPQVADEQVNSGPSPPELEGAQSVADGFRVALPFKPNAPPEAEQPPQLDDELPCPPTPPIPTTTAAATWIPRWEPEGHYPLHQITRSPFSRNV